MAVWVFLHLAFLWERFDVCHFNLPVTLTNVAQVQSSGKQMDPDGIYGCEPDVPCRGRLGQSHLRDRWGHAQ